MYTACNAHTVVAACLALLVTAGGCSESPQAFAQEAARIATQHSPPGEATLPLLVPYRALMLGIIDWSSYGIFDLAADDARMDEGDWTAAGHAAVNLIATSTLLSMPGSGRDDQRRIADPAWIGRVADFQNASVLVAAAVLAQNRTDFNRAADLVADTCQACHRQFKDMAPKDTTEFASR